MGVQTTHGERRGMRASEISIATHQEDWEFGEVQVKSELVK